MRQRSLVFCLLAVITGSALGASPASAQFVRRSVGGPASGEIYRVEGAVGFWYPGAAMSIASESLGIVGTTIDFKKDLGLTDQTFTELHLVLRPFRKHKLRFQYIPIDYSQGPTTLVRAIVFNGQRYDVSFPVTSSLNWKAYRFAYEYDVFTRDSGFVGLVLDAKYTNVTARLKNPLTNEFAHARAPIPALGGIMRYYPVPEASFTFELTGFKIPDSISDDYKGHFVDLDLYGTFNFTRNIGAQLGYRSFDVEYLAKRDTGNFTLKGLYFGVVARY